MPFGRSNGPNTVVIKGDVYIGGGLASSPEEAQIVCVYNPHSDSWSQLPPYGYMDFRLAVISKNKLVAVGGQDVKTFKVTNKLAVWDEQQQQWVFSLPVMNTACFSPAVATYNQWLLVAGGGGEQDRLSRVEVMNVSSEQWFQVTSLPVALNRMTSIMIGNMWYLMGGCTIQPSICKSVMSVCVEHLISEAISQSAGTNSSTSSRWNSLPDTPVGLSTALAFQGALLAVGGGDYLTTTATIYLYQPSASKWILVGIMPTARLTPICTVLPNGHIMIAGGCVGQNQVDIACTSQ